MVISSVTSSNLRPMKRLIEKIVFVGFVTCCRRAGAPTSRWSSFVNATTDGVVRPPSAFAIWRPVSPPSSTAMHEVVVPSGWMVFAMCLASSGEKSKPSYRRYGQSSYGADERAPVTIRAAPTRSLFPCSGFRRKSAETDTDERLDRDERRDDRTPAVVRLEQARRTRPRRAPGGQEAKPAAADPSRAQARRTRSRRAARGRSHRGRHRGHPRREVPHEVVPIANRVAPANA